ncbi:hypothetical protein ABFY81_08900 [Acinetobacter sp. WA-87]|uniref:hypothetical protein n=1 Tax=Acinetobacter sp. WA-87 TaxID=3153556 RepID=UPI0032659863
MVTMNVHDLINGAYDIALNNRDYFLNNHASPNEDSKEFDKKSQEALIQKLLIQHEILNTIKEQIANNNPKFNTAINDLNDYNNNIKGEINNLKTASDIVGLIRDLLAVFGFLL